MLFANIFHLSFSSFIIIILKIHQDCNEFLLHYNGFTKQNTIFKFVFDVFVFPHKPKFSYTWCPVLNRQNETILGRFVQNSYIANYLLRFAVKRKFKVSPLHNSQISSILLHGIDDILLSDFHLLYLVHIHTPINRSKFNWTQYLLPTVHMPINTYCKKYKQLR